MLRRMALICDGLNRAGLETVVHNLTLGLRDRGFDITLVSLSGGPLKEELASVGVDVHVLTGRRHLFERLPRLQSLAAAWKMARLLKNRGIQAICIHGLGPERIALLAAAIAQTRFRTFVFHSNYPALDPDTGDAKLKGRLAHNLRKVDHCIAVTDKIKESVVAAGLVRARNVTVIPNGIDIDSARCVDRRAAVRRELGFTDKDVLLIQVGRFQKPKNQDVSVAAMRHVLHRHESVHLLLVGEGPDVAQTKELAQQLSLAANVHFLGLRSDVTELLGGADIFLLPSSWEGLPISFLEACANSLPLIGTDVPGIRDVVGRRPQCAKLVPPRNPEALAHAICDALDDEKWLQSAGNNAHQLVENDFSLGSMVDQYVAVHTDLCRKTAYLNKAPSIAE